MGGTRRAMLRLFPGPKAPAEARAEIAALAVELPPDTTDNAMLLTSELVTNAVLHGSGMVTVAIECDEQAIAVAVGDESCQELTPRQEPEPAEGGRGLFLLDQLATAWGVRRNQRGGGKVVWFRMV